MQKKLKKVIYCDQKIVNDTFFDKILSQLLVFNAT